MKHSAKKRHLAGQYSNSNILKPRIMGGIQGCANAFVEKCNGSKGESIDAYVYSLKPHLRCNMLTDYATGLSTLLCLRLRDSFLILPLWHAVSRQRGGPAADERALVS